MSMTEREREHASLLPCPFCGFDLRAVDAIDVIYPTTRDGKVWGVHCADYAGGCDASMLGDNPADAAKNWNRRPAAALPAVPSVPEWTAVLDALDAVNEAANDARHRGEYGKANKLVNARVTLYRAALANEEAATPAHDQPEGEG